MNSWLKLELGRLSEQEKICLGRSPIKKLALNPIFLRKMEPNSPIWHEFSTPVAQLIARMCDLVLDWRRILVPNLRIWRLFSLFGRASERMSALLADNSCALAPKKERKDPSWANFHTKLPGMRPTRAILSVKAALRMDIWRSCYFLSARWRDWSRQLPRDGVLLARANWHIRVPIRPRQCGTFPRHWRLLIRPAEIKKK